MFVLDVPNLKSVSDITVSVTEAVTALDRTCPRIADGVAKQVTSRSSAWWTNIGYCLLESRNWVFQTQTRFKCVQSQERSAQALRRAWLPASGQSCKQWCCNTLLTMNGCMHINLNHCWVAQQPLNQTVLDPTINVILVSEQLCNTTDDMNWVSNEESISVL